MDTEGLLFIPDISGFTRFVTETEIDHSRQVIQELLEVVIDANQLGLEVSEVEGDAVLFFRFGACPDVEEICAQVERTFRAFHQRLAEYEVTRFCQCKACTSVGRLTLKIITHYGQFASYSVRSFEKLIGRDVIVAHQLLKNDIEHNEYWLATDGVLPEEGPTPRPGWLEWRSGVSRASDVEVPYRYASLSELRRGVEPRSTAALELANAARMFRLSREYDTHIIQLFHAAGNFTYRSRWQEGVREVKEVAHYLPRVGMRCRRVMADGDEVVYASSYRFTPERIEFSETNEDRSVSLRFTLEAVTPAKTRLTLDYCVAPGLLRALDFRLRRRKTTEASWRRSLENLTRVAGELSVSAEY